jgi:hypothetical protein
MSSTRNKMNRMCCPPTFRGFCCLAICLMLMLPCTGQTRQTHQKQPTLEETTDWIASRILEAGYGYTFTADDGQNLIGTIDRTSASFQGCEMKFKQSGSYVTGNTNVSYTREGSAQLKLLATPILKTSAFELNGGRITSGPKELSTLTLRSQSVKSPAFFVKTTTIFTPDYSSSGSSGPSEVNALSVEFKFTDKDVSERMRKAFQHAITVCGGGKAEPF